MYTQPICQLLVLSMSFLTDCLGLQHEMIRKAASSIARLRSVLDSHVVGQPHVKEGILLALMTREHVYLEGPPGVAKTYTAEITAKATALSAYVYRNHTGSLPLLVMSGAILAECVWLQSSTATRSSPSWLARR